MPVFLFDIDGTLISSGGAGKAAMERALETAFGVTVAEHEIPFSGRTDVAISRDLLCHHSVEATPDNWQRLRAAYLGHLPHSLAHHQGRIMPGIAALLDKLQTWPGAVVGLLTGNIRAGAKIKLGHYGLDHHFAFGGFGDKHDHRDNVAHEALTAARAHLNTAINVRDVWVIGDTPLDVGCARAIGARAVAVATGWHSLEELARSNPDLLMADLSDPAPLLKQVSEA